MTHHTDSDCTLNPADDCCIDCGVYHGEPCPGCGGRGFHVGPCADLCEATDAIECAGMRERLVAGISDTIPDCPVHGPYVEATA